jgi:hypothetical protein
MQYKHILWGLFTTTLQTTDLTTKSKKWSERCHCAATQRAAPLITDMRTRSKTPRVLRINFCPPL